jgi:hypothetical protein
MLLCGTKYVHVEALRASKSGCDAGVMQSVVEICERSLRGVIRKLVVVG